AIPVIICSAKPIYCADTGSLNPNDTPITAKNVPAGVPDITSTITRRPEIAHALIKPASEQHNKKYLCGFLAVAFVFAKLFIFALFMNILYKHVPITRYSAEQILRKINWLKYHLLLCYD